MENKAKTRTEHILTITHILAWVAFIGFMIAGGGLLVTYGISYGNPEAARDLFMDLDLYDLRQFDFWYYTNTISFMVALSVMKSYICYLVIKTMSAFNMRNPFTAEVASKLETISYVAFGTWVVGILSNANTRWLMKKTGTLYGDLVSVEFIWVVALVFIISQVFKRGVEIQTENDLTV